jgi:uncharacterized integral membrane protein
MDQQKGKIGWRSTMAVGLGVLLAIVALQNSQSVDVEVLMVNVSAPLIVVILAAAGIGGVIGYVAPLVHRHRRGDKDVSRGQS